MMMRKIVTMVLAVIVMVMMVLLLVETVNLTSFSAVANVLMPGN